MCRNIIKIKTETMKNALLIIFSLCIVGTSFAQVFPQELDTQWDFKDDSKKVIVVTYDLPDFDDLRYLKIVAKAYVDDRLVPMRSLRGDIGEAVKVGKAKTIEWNWENDVVEIAGELRFVVTADNPNPVDENITTVAEPKMDNPTIPVVKVLALPVIAGGGLAITGLLSSSGAKSDWNAMTVAERTQDEYDSLNGKYKTGQYLTIGGGVVILAGVIWYIKEKAAMNSYTMSRISVEPGVGNLTNLEINKPLPQAQFGMSINYKF